jgi:hypothetical protein
MKIQGVRCISYRKEENMQVFYKRRSGFDPGSVHVGFVVDKVALGQVFSQVLRVSPVSFSQPVLHYLEK